MESSAEGSTTLENSAMNEKNEPTRPMASTTARGSQREALRSRSGATTTSAAPSSRFALFRERTRLLLDPPRPVGKPPGVFQSIKAIITSSYLNILLLCIPVSWAMHFALPASMANRDTLIFVFSFLAIIPLASLLAFATEELSLRVGQTLAGLLNATLGNAVELIVAIIALVKCQLQVVQASLVGSILSNLLLVLGMCFFAGGLKYSEQGFGISATQLNASLLTVSVIAVLLPAAFHFTADAQLSDDQEANDILSVSHGVAIILLFIYASYLIFQLYSHKSLYQDDDAVKTIRYKTPKFRLPKHRPHFRNHDADAESSSMGPTRTNTETNMANGDMESSQSLPARSTHFGEQPTIPESTTSEEEEEEQPTMSVWMTIGLLVAITVLVAVTAEFLVDSINGIADTGHISKEFIGIILLPIVGNAAEHVTAVTVSVKDKLNLSLGVAVGSSIQIALFVIPFIVTLAWILGKPLTLLFDPYESVAMFLAVLTVNYVVQDGKSNWLEGLILMCLYLILAVTFWFYPGVQSFNFESQCH